MTIPDAYGVFISYSHEDAILVTPMVRLLRYERNDLVFHDKTDIRDGEPWEPQLMQRLGEVHTVMVFWCRHSAASEYVKREYLEGIRQQKKILPILLDETKMSDELSRYQGIDFRDSHIHGGQAMSPPKSRKSPVIAVIISIAVLILFALGLMFTPLQWWYYAGLAVLLTMIITVMATRKSKQPKTGSISDKLEKQVNEAHLEPDVRGAAAVTANTVKPILIKLDELIPRQ